MILHELTQSEDHPVYQSLTVSNATRQNDFLRSIISVAIEAQKPYLSHDILKALNFHAIACLHTNAGEYRPCQVKVGSHIPPEHFRVQAQMDDFINEVNRFWEKSDPVVLASFVLWKLNYIHPFINGNGRTARAACYFVLCVKIGHHLPGNVILPELIKKNRNKYVKALKKADKSWKEGNLNLSMLNSLLSDLIQQQLNSVLEET